MPTQRTGNNAYAIQAYGFGSTGDTFNVASQVSGGGPTMLGPVDYANPVVQLRVLLIPPELQPEVFQPEAASVTSVDLTPATETDLATRVGVFMAANETDSAVALSVTHTSGPRLLTLTGVGR